MNTFWTLSEAEYIMNVLVYLAEKLLILKSYIATEAVIIILHATAYCMLFMDSAVKRIHISELFY